MGSKGGSVKGGENREANVLFVGDPRKVYMLTFKEFVGSSSETRFFL